MIKKTKGGHTTEEQRTMEEKRQILFMQVRLLKMASEEFKLSLADTARLFKKYDVLGFIRELYGLFHTEGDLAIFEDIKVYLKSKGADVCNL